MKSVVNLFRLCSIVFLLASCSVQRKIGRMAEDLLLQDTSLSSAHVGISIFDQESSRYLYNYQGEKYFVPASNTKIFTLYAGMKYLGDSIAGMQYIENDTAIFIKPTGDPTLLHRDFKVHPVANFLRSAVKPIYINASNWDTEALGSGWAWNDYNAYYMPERSAFPAYGNVIRWVQEKTGEAPADDTQFDQTVSIYSIPEIDWDVRFNPSGNSTRFDVQRNWTENVFRISQGQELKRELEVPFITNGIVSSVDLLNENLDKNIIIRTSDAPASDNIKTVYSQHADSLFKPLMYRSDNFYAEQVLLMVSQKLLGKMNNADITDSLLKSDLAGLPQQPRWADGSGLSRYNLFTPQSFVSILGLMQREFGMDRLTSIFASGGSGTLGNFYKEIQGNIYAKTGTLSGVVALSGYLVTRKNKMLYFSVLVNNHRGNAVAIRRKVEDFLVGVYNRY